MKELIETLQKIDTDFYNGGITFGQKYDLVNAIEEVLYNVTGVKVEEGTKIYLKSKTNGNN